jgi:O-antigen ligase
VPRGPWAYRVAEAAVLAAVVGIPLVNSPIFYRVYPVPKIALFRAMVAVVLLAACVLVARRRELGTDFGTVDLILSAFLVWMLVAALASRSPAASLVGVLPNPEGWLGFLGYAVFFWFASKSGETVVRRLLAGIAGASAVVGALAAAEMQGFYMPTWRGVYGARAVSTLGNPDAIAALAAIAIPLTLGLLHSARSWGARVVWGVAFSAQIGGLYYSFGRGGWLGTLVGVAIFYVLVVIFEPGRRRWAAIGQGILVIALAASVLTGLTAMQPEAARDGIRRMYAAEDVKTGTAGTRLEVWGGTLGLIGRRPVAGWGEDTFMATFARVRSLRLLQLEDYHRYFDRPHNLWLYLAYAGGVPALVLYLMFLLALAGVALRELYRRRHTGGAVLIAACAAALVAHEVEGFFGSSLTALSALAFVAQGGLVALSKPEAVVEPAREPKRGFAVGPRIGMAAAAMAVLAVALFATAARDCAADYMYTLGIAQARHPRSALPLVHQAVALSPGHPVYEAELAVLYEQLHDRACLARAQRILERAMALGPWDPRIGPELGRVLAREHRLGDAARAYRKVLVADPYNGAALYGLASLDVRARQPDSAVPLLRRLLAADPADEDAWGLLALASDLAGNRTVARLAHARSQKLGHAEAVAAPAAARGRGGGRARVPVARRPRLGVAQDKG